MVDFNNGKCSIWSATNEYNASITSITISEGPLAGIIIAMNITSVSTIDYLDSNNWLVYTARVFVSLMNLNLGFPMCLYNGMTPTVKTAIQFVYPVYLWVLVIGFIIFSHYSTRISNRTASYSVQVLASLIHLSFSKVLTSLSPKFSSQKFAYKIIFSNW